MVWDAIKSIAAVAGVAKGVGGLLGSRSTKSNAKDQREYYNNLAQYNIDMSMHNAGFQRQLANYYMNRVGRSYTDLLAQEQSLFADASAVVNDKYSAYGLRDTLRNQQLSIRNNQQLQALDIRGTNRQLGFQNELGACLLYTSPSPRDS